MKDEKEVKSLLCLSTQVRTNQSTNQMLLLFITKEKAITRE